MSLTIILLTLVSPLVTGLGVEVEDVTGRQLEAALQTEDVLAVMFCKSLLLPVCHSPCVTPRVLLPVCFPCVPRPLDKLSPPPSVFISMLSGGECCVTNCVLPPARLTLHQPPFG